MAKKEIAAKKSEAKKKTSTEEKVSKVREIEAKGKDSKSKRESPVKRAVKKEGKSVETATLKAVRSGVESVSTPKSVAAKTKEAGSMKVTVMPVSKAEVKEKKVTLKSKTKIVATAEKSVKNKLPETKSPVKLPAKEKTVAKTEAPEEAVFPFKAKIPVNIKSEKKSEIPEKWKVGEKKKVSAENKLSKTKSLAKGKVLPEAKTEAKVKPEEFLVKENVAGKKKMQVKKQDSSPKEKESFQVSVQVADKAKTKPVNRSVGTKTPKKKISKSDITNALKKHFGFDKFKGNQLDIIQNVIAEKDTFVLMPTGGGKSLCYQLPALLMEGTALVISPLIALMKNQVDAMRNFSEEDGVAHFINSSLSKEAINEVKADILLGNTKLLYVAPESLTKEENIEFLRQIKISFYAVDEAHCISEWGHDFRPEYRRIRPLINEIENRPVIALTATATPKVQHDIQKNLGMMNATVFSSSFNRPNLYYEVRQKTEDIDRDIIKFIRANEGKSGIIYCLSRREVEKFAEILQANGIKALPYHAGMESQVRTETQDAFLMEEIDVIVATIAFGMGIDKPDVRYVIHYDIPKSLEGYYQETGRAGRDGGEGKCIAFYANKDLQKLEKFLQGKPVGEQEIGKQLLLETAAYAETAMCRRKVLLHYFGEKYEEDNCGSCDNCLNPKALMEAKEHLVTVLETISTLKEKYKTDYIINIIVGKETSDNQSYGHDELEIFGSGDDEDEKLWQAIIRQAQISGYIEKDIENYGLLKITPKGRAFMKKPVSFKVIKDNEFDEDDGAEEAPVHGGAFGAVDPELFSIMKDLRKKLSKQLELPPYVIFQDPSLEAMATTYPISIEELQNIPGVGTGKAKRYGKEFVEIIKKYVEENEIERPEDLRVRTIANKSKLKVWIVQSIDRKVALDDIAISKGLDFGDLLTEIESIVDSGTHINIDYFIREIVDEDHVEEIYDYFKESTSGAISKAIDELGNDYTEEEIRLVRIKFLSEVAN